MNTHLHSKITHWLAQEPDPAMAEEIQALLDNGDEVELAARFAGRLAFGTAGLRGIAGAGPMRMNRLVVQQTSKGLGQYLIEQVKQAKTRGVVIGYDGRNDSCQFAHDAAGVLAELGIHVMLTHDVAPTPLVAFGVKHFHAAAGIVVTASHNPPEYNGYKVYWENGAQIIPPHDAGIAACIETAAQDCVSVMDLNQAGNAGLLQWLQDDFYQLYRRTVRASRELSNHSYPERVSLSYTAMHGVGAKMAEQLLADAGFTHVYPVEEQRWPDGNFPTVAFPNPEEPGAMDMVIAAAKEHGALLACANDPDADRFAVAVKRDDSYQMLTGDQVGVLLGHYLLSHAPVVQRLVGNTIVSSSLLGKVAAKLGGSHYTTLTGFKWLMNVGQAQQTETCRFLFAYEEALGYTVGNTVWDKDGLSAQLAFVQLTAELAGQGLSVWDRLESIYREHGFHLNEQVSIKLQPETPDIGAYLREHVPTHIAGSAVVMIDDINTSCRYYADGRTELLHLPASDVLIYCLENDSRVIVRPSGTEPKIKCYYEVVTQMTTNDTLQSAQQRAQSQMAEFIAEHQASLPK
ncbi:phosphoglucomutase [Shewanella sp. NFH-SH190041]|uniref:phospho-sugar mutase n=1 Tax=Shewanella sp. NFH-SH190041 TaxID=2950245 RepID=UPI0021C2E202|nr:phospho-sugar mutase [Shewanella sp. NFH-SH190041]BDM65071.1 phosphoglucomutase [Shewanella sp. NFH-SH190041]